MQVERLEALPVLVKKTGVYKTRSGEKATVYAFDSHSLFGARGAVQPAKGRPRINAWHVSGRALAVGTSPDDLVEFCN